MQDVSLTFYNISGMFNDNGEIRGSFEYDSGTSEYTNINITTTSGDVPFGATYEATSIFGSDNGFLIYDDTFTFFLDILFEGSGLVGEPASVGLRSDTQEDNFDTEEFRTITTGSVTAATAIPFEFSPSLGLLLLLTTFGVQQGWKNRRNG